jgi:alpha-tubulin suppressor-like RCC1 family protein
MMALGSAHTVCVNNKGRLYTFGWNNYGQCGVPINSTVISKDEIDNEYLVEMTEYNELRPRILNKVDGIKLPQIEQVIFSKNLACGEDHSLILDHEGSVWAFGLNLNGQLGLGHAKVIEKPTKIKSLSKYFITHVKSEGDINFAVSDKGEAFMWPWSDKFGNMMLDPIRLPLNTQT